MNCDLETIDYYLMMFNAGFCNLYEYTAVTDSQKNHIVCFFAVFLTSGGRFLA